MAKKPKKLELKVKGLAMSTLNLYKQKKYPYRLLLSKLNFNLWQIFIDGPYGAPARYMHICSVWLNFILSSIKTELKALCILYSPTLLEPRLKPLSVYHLFLGLGGSQKPRFSCRWMGLQDGWSCKMHGLASTLTYMESPNHIIPSLQENGLRCVLESKSTSSLLWLGHPQLDGLVIGDGGEEIRVGRAESDTVDTLVVL